MAVVEQTGRRRREPWERASARDQIPGAGPVSHHGLKSAPTAPRRSAEQFPCPSPLWSPGPPFNLLFAWFPRSAIAYHSVPGCCKMAFWT